MRLFEEPSWISNRMHDILRPVKEGGEGAEKEENFLLKLSSSLPFRFRSSFSLTFSLGCLQLPVRPSFPVHIPNPVTDYSDMYFSKEIEKTNLPGIPMQ